MIDMPIKQYFLILASVLDEIGSIINLLENKKAITIGNRDAFYGQIAGHNVLLLVTGPGIVNTVQALTATIEKVRPLLIVQTGIAGCFKESGLNIGDIAVASEEIDRHLGIESESESESDKFGIIDLPFPVLRNKKIEITNRYPFEKKIVNSFYASLSEHIPDKRISVKTGPFITVSTITATDLTASLLYKKYKCLMESMEGSGAVHVALHYGIACVEIRTASNFVEKRNISKWNFPLAFERIGIAIETALRYGISK